MRARIARAAQRAGRDPQSILLVGVTKTTPPERVLEAVRAGVTTLAENYVQEAREKIPLVGAALEAEALAARWHLIGHLQTNKAKYCPALFHVVETVDNFGLVKELAKAASKQNGMTLDLLVEVNLSDDPARAGVAPEDALALCAQAAQVPCLSLTGLMGVAPYNRDPEAARPAFRQLRTLWEQLPPENRRILSMGMSGDFEIAIEEGATQVRIGSALFGERPPRPI
ncbi:MAG: YggS family pyridoxal phosphate-dependent enzyme [Cytophagales bacterium]|nr:YggS family pyridoxal phosphate-dependent enzyme [Armatimonadota bacterium]